ncbi:MAG: hypothetical protein Crog4KO_06010 [Crocinitomicaceae bacterium]
MSENEDILDSVAVTHTDMAELSFPMEFTFKIGTIWNDFVAKDANGSVVAYVRQKMFKLKESVSVYNNDAKSVLLFKISADRWIDYNASYRFTVGESETATGRVGRKGRKSIWKATYEIFDVDDTLEFTIREENPWAKVWDALLGEIPVISMFTGYLANPRYVIENTDGQAVIRFKKKPSFFGRHFTLEKVGELNKDQGERVLLSLMMMSLLERRRG